jgi:hypothetical protein
LLLRLLQMAGLPTCCWCGGSSKGLVAVWKVKIVVHFTRLSLRRRLRRSMVLLL